VEKHRKKNETVLGVIPARYDSTRFPGKPLVNIGGKPMIQWVVERVSCAQLVSKVIVATDDDRIFTLIQKLGKEVVMTPKGFRSGTDRVAFVARELDAEIIVNIQGDEPFIQPQEVDLVAKILLNDREAVVGTLVKKITDVEELENPNTAKVVVDHNKNALYFSRHPIPFYRDYSQMHQWVKKHTYYKHVGIYSYRRDFLILYASWGPSILEKAEKLEQLRILERGYSIKVAETSCEPVCVDTPEDVAKVQRLLATGRISKIEES
jgi:3-deoxy-manno-octulosonate cytidylyltransferase (CMP-KDO synthetase)